ncbi:MAG: DUF3034 family protein [Pseudomonadota bacterium]|nr:DUF3034 family protein [Pseudomonadota bacterium]
MTRLNLVFLAAAVWAAGTSAAVSGDRLAWTGAVTEIEGSAGGGLVPWALIGGLGTAEQIGATGSATYVSTGDFNLRTAGLSIEADDRVEVSYARQRFDAGAVIPGLVLGQDVVGIKVRVAGDAVFEPDRWLPQLAVGAQWKHTLDFTQIPRALGAASGQDVELYVAATKLYFAAVAGRNVLLDLTARRTRANQFGLLGFGGEARPYQWEPEASAAVFVTETWLLGGEYRAKPDNLAAFHEDAAKDVFLAWGPAKNLSLTVAAVDLGRIAGKPPQRGVYVSLWVGI